MINYDDYVDVVFDIGTEKISMIELGYGLESLDDPFPEPKTEYIDIPGTDGETDFTDNFGETFFQNKLITMVFSKTGEFDDFDKTRSSIAKIPGKRLDCYIQTEFQWYYTGRCSVTHTITEGVDSLVIKMNAQPYRHRKKADGSLEVSL